MYGMWILKIFQNFMKSPCLTPKSRSAPQVFRLPNWESITHTLRYVELGGRWWLRDKLICASIGEGLDTALWQERNVVLPKSKPLAKRMHAAEFKVLPFCPYPELGLLGPLCVSYANIRTQGMHIKLVIYHPLSHVWLLTFSHEYRWSQLGYI